VTPTNGIERAQAREGQPKRLLVIEDDAATRETLVTVLGAEGYVADRASDGAEALAFLNREPTPDLILLDLRMPGMDGWTFRVAQQRNSALATIPVIAMSADGTSRAAAISAEAFLKKPLNMPDLLAAIERVLAENERRKQSVQWTIFERMAALGQVAAGVGHEINNPLAFVLMNITLVRDGLRGIRGAQSTAANAESWVECLDESLIGLERIRGIVRNLQNLSRKPDAERVPLDIEKLLDDSLVIARNHLVPRARVTTRYRKVPRAMGRPGDLGQVFLNLLINAAQAIPKGDASRNEILVSTDLAGGDIVIEIADTGRGISPEILPRIFDPFFTTKGDEEGTGLGLAICKRIVADHGGTLTVESEVGHGTVCRIRLTPASGDAGTRGSVAAATSSTPPVRRARILVIDDEEMICRVVRQLLTGRHDVVVAQSAQAAFETIERDGRFDVVLCDLIMPGASGSDVFDTFAARWPELRSRLIFMTGGVFSDGVREFLDATHRPILYKPFTAAELGDFIDAHLEPGTEQHDA
jgi:signal transduction histidine kinase